MCCHTIHLEEYVRWWKKFFTHFFGHAVVNAHILHCKTSIQMILNLSYKMVAEGLLSEMGKENHRTTTSKFCRQTNW
jgi:hypothetical protein